MLTYRKLEGVKTGLLMNFNATSGGVVNRTGYYTPPGLRAGSNASSFDSFVLFVSFVVKQFCASARVLSLHPFSLVTHSKQRRAQFLWIGF